tara:strand:- start:1424 stop:1729 length:306 start_codon:yes stop_codon:yes gene_type:complete
MGIYTGHNPSSQDDIDNMTDAEMADHLGVPEAVQEDAEWCCDCFPRLAKLVLDLQSRIADLETVIDEIPNMGALFGAVQELQEQHEAPANTFTHYIGGSRV